MCKRLLNVALMSSLATVSGGCVYRKAAQSRVPAVEKAGEAVAAPSVANYMRGVVKISIDNASKEEGLQRLLEAQPQLAELAKRVSSNPADFASAKTLGAAYLAADLYGSAYEIYNRVQLAGAKDPVVELALGQIWDAWGDYTLAEEYTRRAAELAPKSAGPLALLGRIYLHAHQVDRALPLFLKALKLDPHRASVLSDCGYAFLLKGDLARAKTYLSRAVQRDGAIAEIRNNLGIVLANLGDAEGALREFTAAGSRATAHNNLGAVYCAQGKWREARSEFRLALSLDPGYLKARQNLEEIDSLFPPPTVVNLPPAGAAKANSGQGRLPLHSIQRIMQMADSGMQGVPVSVRGIPASEPSPEGARQLRVDAAEQRLSLADYSRRVFTLSMENAAHAAGYAVQVYATRTLSRAEARSAQLARKGVRATVQAADLDGGGTWYRLRIPGYDTFRSAFDAAMRLANRGIINDYWIVRENS